MILSIFGFLVDPTDQYLSKAHKQFSHGFVWFITNIVGSVTPLAFISLIVFLLGQLNLIPIPSVFTQLSQYRFLSFILGSWMLAEIAWYLYCMNLKRKFGVHTSFPGLSPQERQQYLTRVLDHCTDPLSSLVRWFHKSVPEHIGSECMEEWISWAFFSKDIQHLTVAENEELGTLVDKVIQKCPEIGRPSADHVKYRLNFMRLHFDEMVFQHKPFIAYVVISIMQKTGTTYLEWIGFKHHSLPGNHQLSYMSYNPTKKVHGEERPIFLVHGIGIGVVMYINVIKAIVMRDPSRPVYILELPHISLKVLPSVANMDETLEAIDEIYRRHKLTSCSWLAHSYGTIVTAWVLKERPGYVNKINFVDPVCFALWEPDLIYNFLYRKPTGPIHRLCQFYVAQDLLVSFTLFRNFWWLQNILFPEDVLCPTTVFLSSHDFIIDAESTYTYLTKQLELEKGIKEEKKAVKDREFKIVKMNGLSHGSFLNSPEFISKIVDCL